MALTGLATTFDPTGLFGAELSHTLHLAWTLSPTMFDVTVESKVTLLPLPAPRSVRPIQPYGPAELQPWVFGLCGAGVVPGLAGGFGAMSNAVTILGVS